MKAFFVLIKHKELKKLGQSQADIQPSLANDPASLTSQSSEAEREN